MKRFEFDYNKMERFKVNDFCEFPETINFKPWTKEGILEREKRTEMKSEKSNEENEVESDFDVEDEAPIQESNPQKKKPRV